MDLKKNAAAIEAGRTALGLELGSTNIKMVLVNEACETLASTSYGWENQLENGIWTYDLATVWLGIEDAFHSLTADVQSRYHVELKTIGSIGVSAMMHGYLPFDKDGKQLAQALYSVNLDSGVVTPEQVAAGAFKPEKA